MTSIQNMQIANIFSPTVALLGNQSIAPFNVGDFDVLDILSIAHLDGNFQLIYMLWCSETQNFVATWTIDSTGRASLTPGTQIKLKSTNQPISFKLYNAAANGVIQLDTGASPICIIANLIKYKST